MSEIVNFFSEVIYGAVQAVIAIVAWIVIIVVGFVIVVAILLLNLFAIFVLDAPYGDYTGQICEDFFALSTGYSTEEVELENLSCYIEDIFPTWLSHYEFEYTAPEGLLEKLQTDYYVEVDRVEGDIIYLQKFQVVVGENVAYYHHLDLGQNGELTTHVVLQ
jgi:hypothetical protein